ncbi:MAG: hypothetical protein IIZ44_07740 [Muribaculaceae bacterium]|jgi:hypothetical protein|nr:hypothetical protein [Muribaculaceae bacterium]MBQ1585385.1 hypothetical protein [Muribaculaceae bacterium]MBQ1746141.1 hypothetical protein [Muribaculaceae bacterium]MBR0492447.1 hypothetical protein [Muribaculaceae bacterium]
MKKFLLMFAAVAAIAFVGCKTETKPAEEAAVEEAPVAEYTVDGVANDLLNCADEAAAVSLLDGIKAKAEELLNGGDQAGYFNIINILKTVWDNNKDAILAKIPTLAEKMTGYIDVPENLKAGFAEFVAKQAAEKVEGAVDAAKDAANATVDAAGEKVDAAKEAVKDAAGNAVDAAKEKAAEGVDAAADKVKKAIN